MPSFPILGATVNTDLLLISDDEFDTFNAPLVNDLASSAVILEPVELSHYHYEEVWMSVDQIPSSTYPLRDIQSSQVKCLIVSIRAFALDNRNEVMAVI